MVLGDWTRARKVNNWEDDATGGTLWTSTTTFTVTVPANRRWLVLGTMLYRSDAATAQAIVYDSSGNVIYDLWDIANGTGRSVWPEYGDSDMRPYALILDAGEYITITCSAAQGATAEAAIQVLEVSI